MVYCSWLSGKLFDVDDIASAVGVKAGFLDGIVEFAGVSDFFKGKFGVSFVSRDYCHRAYANNTVEQASAKFQVNYSKHIQIVHFSIEKTSAPLDSVGGDLIAGHF